MGRFRAVIFDLDGTLLDTEPLLDQANAAVLRRYGCALTHDLRLRLAGRSRRDSNRLLAEAAGPSVDPEELGTARSAILDAAWHRAELMPGAAGLVARVAAAGLPMAIATSSTMAALEQKLRRHEAIRRAMQTVVCSDHPAVRRGKPAPDIFLVAAAELSVEPAACVALEDAPSGIQAAVAAGMHVIAVPATWMRGHRMLTAAHRVVDDLHEVDPDQW